MIPKSVEKYCCDDPSLIENYDKAMADQTQMWECHHRKETDDDIPRDLLIMLDMYYNVPAEELILLSQSEHRSMHKKGKKMNETHKAKIGCANRGAKNHKARAVYQIDMTSGAIIKKWKCIREAERELKIAQPNITACCKGRISSAYGYVWRYADEYVKPTNHI